MFKNITWLFFSLLMVSRLQAQDQNTYQLIRHLTMEDGLPSNNVYSIVEDSKGFLWLATDDGVVKYDGENMKIFTTADGLPKNDIFDVREDSWGRIWLMCQADDIVYIKNDSVFQTYNEYGNLFISDFMEHDEGIIWQNGYHVFKERGDTILKCNAWNQECFRETNFKITVDRSYIVTKENPNNYVKEELSRYLELFSSNYSPESDTIFKVVDFHSDGSRKLSSNINLPNLWSKSNHFTYYFRNNLAIHSIENSTLVYYDGHVKKLKSINYSLEGKRRTFISKLRATASGYDLVTNGTLYRFEPESERIEQLNLKALSYTKQPTSFVIKGNLLYLSSLDNGLLVFYIQEKSAHNQLLLADISAFESNEEKIYLGTKNGKILLLRKDLNSLDSLSIRGFGGDPSITKIQFIPSENALYFLNKSSGIGKCLTSSAGRILEQNLTLAGQPSLGYRGFIYFGGDVFYQQGASTVTIKKLNRASNRILLAKIVTSEFVALDAQDSSRVQLIYNNKMYTHDIKSNEFDTLKFDFNITTLHQTKDQFLLGTDGQGVYAYDSKNANSTNILPDKTVNHLSRKNKIIYVSTPRGAYLLKGEHPYEIKSYFSKSEGLLSNDVKFATAFQDKHLFITSAGIQLIDTSTKTSISQVELYIDEPSLNYEDTIRLDHTRDITFPIKKIDYAGYPMDYYLSFSNASDQFQKATSSNISYQDLNPGNYSFKVYGRNEDHNYETEVLTKTVIIPYKIYERPLFKLFLGLLAALGTFYLIRRRFRFLQQKEGERLEIEKEYAGLELQALQSQMNPHFVFNCLNSIQTLISKNEMKEANRYLTKFSRLMRKFLDQSTQQVTTLENELEINKLYLELEKLRFKDKLNFEINIAENVRSLDVKIPAVIVQPFVENAIRHGIFHKDEPGHIFINVDQSEESLTIEVVDDGIGIEASKKINQTSRINHKSRGTQLLLRKAELLAITEKIDVEISITDRSDAQGQSGTVVTILISPSDT